jgi:hypothetical protein
MSGKRVGDRQGRCKSVRWYRFSEADYEQNNHRQPESGQQSDALTRDKGKHRTSEKDLI